MEHIETKFSLKEFLTISYNGSMTGIKFLVPMFYWSGMNQSKDTFLLQHQTTRKGKEYLRVTHDNNSTVVRVPDGCKENKTVFEEIRKVLRNIHKDESVFFWLDVGEYEIHETHDINTSLEFGAIEITFKSSVVAAAFVLMFALVQNKDNNFFPSLKIKEFCYQCVLGSGKKITSAELFASL